MVSIAVCVCVATRHRLANTRLARQPAAELRKIELIVANGEVTQLHQSEVSCGWTLASTENDKQSDSSAGQCEKLKQAISKVAQPGL